MELTSCRSCGGPSPEWFLSLGEHPLPNRFLTKAELRQPEPRYPLDLFFCGRCSLVQLGLVVPPEMLFSHYAYASSTSATFRAHFDGLADYLVERFDIGPGSTVVDIGSNDGVLLRPLQERGVRAIGVEPAGNLYELAQMDGLEVINDFFDHGTVEAIGRGTADAVTACNVFAHVENIQGPVENVRRLLKPGGLFVVEVQYAGAMISDLTFDNIYLEHIYYWTLGSLARFLNAQGMRIVDVEEIPTHGGSLRVAAASEESPWPVSARVESILSQEESAGLRSQETFSSFAKKVEEVKDGVAQLLAGLNGQVAGYGAPAKSTTLLNYCGIDQQTVPYIVDDSPLKQGLFTPGTHIPVVGPEVLEEKRPSYILILAWNFADDIIEKTKHLGADYILPVPPRLFSAD